jgi:CheY-like chemotaxis protein
MEGSPPLRELQILIVEDEENIVRTLTDELGQAFPDAKIDSAHTVAEGEEKLHQSLDLGRPYDVVVLDFKLPPDRLGQDPEPDHSLGIAFRRDSPQTLIIHITAYKADIGLKGYLREKGAPAEKGRLFIAKDIGWMKLLPKEIIRGVPAYRIRREFDELFRRRRTIGWQRAGQRRWAIGRSDRARSLAVAELCAYASQNWELLSGPLQNDLKRALGYAEDEKGNHYLGVMEAGTEDKGGADEEDL